MEDTFLTLQQLNASSRCMFWFIVISKPAQHHLLLSETDLDLDYCGNITLHHWRIRVCLNHTWIIKNYLGGTELLYVFYKKNIEITFIYIIYSHIVILFYHDHSSLTHLKCRTYQYVQGPSSPIHKYICKISPIIYLDVNSDDISRFWLRIVKLVV